MILAKITFGTDGGKLHERNTLKDRAEWYLAALLKNGQIYGDYLVAWSNGNLVAYANIARPDALDERHHSEWSKAQLDLVLEAFGRPVNCEVIDDAKPKRFRSWKQSTSLYLFTHGFDEASPVCCGDTGFPIPLYLLPVTPKTREDLYFWAGSYKAHDKIWLDSGALEIPAYKQLADPESSLSVTGRGLCAEIERVTKTPTFYYVHRYWGRNDGEAIRPCPICGSKWHLSEAPAERHAFHEFHFRCEHCRLISDISVSCEDERHARIGEYKKQHNKQRQPTQ